MNRGYDYKKYTVLMVDDEVQALKYFDKAFAKDFQILTAASAELAWELLEQKGDQIGVLVTDQRMPGKSGVDLLDQVRQKWPGIVRIITTAYSEIDSAIGAVNRGGVFRYMAKPWDIRELQNTLFRAMEFFIVHRERDILLREKLSVLQRMIVLDRVRSFTVLAASLTFRIRYSMTALKAFFDCVPVAAIEKASESTVNWDDLWSVAQNESQRIVEAVDEVLAAVVEKEYAFTDEISVDDLVRRQLQKVESRLTERGVTSELRLSPDIAPLKADVTMVERLVDILMNRVMMLVEEGQNVIVQANGQQEVFGAPGIQLFISCNASEWNEDQLAVLFGSLHPTTPNDDDMGTDVLSAFFIAHHHGGNLLVHKSGPNGPGFELQLPYDPEATVRPPLESNWLDRIFTSLEGW